MKSLKNILNKGLLLLAMIWTTGIIYAQIPAEGFQGTIVYNIRLTGKSAQNIMANEPATKMTMHVRENDYIVKLSGGQIPRVFLFLADSNHTFIVDIPNERYFRRTYYVPDSAYQPIARPTGETRKVKGIDTQEYLAVDPAKKTKTYYYVTDEYRVDSTLFDGLGNARADFLVAGLGGRIPLWKEIKTPDLTTTIELASIKRQEFPKEAFMIPEGFSSKRKRDPRK